MAPSGFTGAILGSFEIVSEPAVSRMDGSEAAVVGLPGCLNLGILRSERPVVHLYAPVAQLDRAAAFEAVGREFESLQARLPQHPSTCGRTALIKGLSCTSGGSPVSALKPTLLDTGPAQRKMHLSRLSALF
jgi:hypothetical protein